MSGLQLPPAPGLKPPTGGISVQTTKAGAAGVYPVDLGIPLLLAKLSAGYADAVNVSGTSGVLELLVISCTNTTSTTASGVRLTIDGTIVYTNASLALTSTMWLPIVGQAHATGGTYRSCAFAQMRFEDSLRIEIAGQGSVGLNAYGRYYTTG